MTCFQPLDSDPDLRKIYTITYLQPKKDDRTNLAKLIKAIPYPVPVFRIRIRVDPNSNYQAGSGSVFGIRILKVKLSYKNPLFPQIFHNFHLFFKMIPYLPNKSSLFNKIPTYLIG